MSSPARVTVGPVKSAAATAMATLAVIKNFRILSLPVSGVDRSMGDMGRRRRRSTHAPITRTLVRETETTRPQRRNGVWGAALRRISSVQSFHGLAHPIDESQGPVPLPGFGLD